MSDYLKIVTTTNMKTFIEQTIPTPRQKFDYTTICKSQAAFASPRPYFALTELGLCPEGYLPPFLEIHGGSFWPSPASSTSHEAEVIGTHSRVFVGAWMPCEQHPTPAFAAIFCARRWYWMLAQT
mmetsp:Transcript_10668/g.19699  ORF Transcript_10668/g.19699 Transcript_10668/m.19699 type:complete len:125 (+) Transcript_10668:1745-2119(+)